ncbi:MAG: Hpt domain-containing protein [Oligoflexales bacterium]|nr:Hpt domain-containing protein [Oligoflexales bacterium]
MLQRLGTEHPFLQVRLQQWSENLDLSEYSLFFVELQEEVFFEDVDMVRKIRVARPLSPIIGTSEQLRSGLITVAFESGLSDYVLPNTSISMLGAKLKAAYKVAKTSILVEIQNHELLESTRSLRASYTKLKEEIEARKTAETERDIATKLAQLHEQNKEILDNLLSGFFTFEKDLKIAETTSKACEDLFFNKIAGKHIEDALDLNESTATFLTLSLEQLFDNIIPNEVSLSFVPKKIETKHDKIIDLHYTPVYDADKEPHKIIVVATDITAQVAETKKLQQKEKLNQILINILHHNQTFKLFLKNYKSSLQTLKSTTSEVEARRILHTLKGNSLTFGFEHIGSRIHDMETKLNQESEFDFEVCQNDYCPELESLMADFLERNSAILGIDYNQKYEVSYTLNEELLKRFYNIAENMKSQETKTEYLALLNLHKLSPISIFTEVINQKIPNIIKKLEKSIEFKIRGDNILIDRDRLQGVFDNLIHGVANACAHGIEPEQERLEKKKQAKGKVQLAFSKNGHDLMISIRDDGAGINTDKVVKSALKNGFIKEADIPKLKQEEIFGLIFSDRLSTADKVNEIAGRGVGLSALKNAVEATGGRIKIDSQANRGTNINIFLPNGCTYQGNPFSDSD